MGELADTGNRRVMGRQTPVLTQKIQDHTRFKRDGEASGLNLVFRKEPKLHLSEPLLRSVSSL